MKLNKKLLKSIVKECLVEILAEGLVPGDKPSYDKRLSLKESVNNVSNNKIKKRSIDQNVNLGTKGSYLDHVNYNNTSENNPQYERTKRTISNITKDPIMSDILADTARSTLIEQRETQGAGKQLHSRPADNAARIVAESDPSELFGNSASKWADLAFSPKLQK